MQQLLDAFQIVLLRMDADIPAAVLATVEIDRIACEA